MQSRKLSLMSFAVAAIAFAFTMDAQAATLAVSSALNHADLIGGHLGAGALAIGSVTAAGAGESVKHAATRFFRIAVEGATSDGRTIDRASLTQMAKNYNPEMYGARLNLEHYRGIIPDSPFKAYGDVIALETRDETGPLAGKLGLYAQIAPTPDLVALTKAKQKIYTSCEIDPSFADTNQAYLVGLAVTDSPASLGTQVLSFAAQNPAASPFASRKLKPTNLFTAAEDPVTIEFDEAAAPAFGALFSRVAELLGKSKKKDANDDTRFADVGQAVETLATHGKQQADAVASLTQTVKELSELREADRKAFDELHTQLSKTSNTPTRPPATGAPAAVVTDC
ncbi:GPO family capsid scaffolding protein [Paraburkholderia bryophila]|uniref:Capsid scaffolding serine peptidase GPO n=1 Tax=Paraburkholderia bryophila TaxID=420952 RepID=A0A329B964_9BURK|nr:GPO family capsid scaffolding protein [Paraburkholderia bryophila]RAS15836.1 capsid scaffolding serine peptidase GPO [Paraburkholderia bryophila]